MKKLFLIPLLTLVCSVMAWATDITTGAALKSFLEAAGTGEATVTADVDISSSAITMKGTKTLTINEGVTVYYLRQSSGPNIKVPAGTSLTLLGSGTIRPVAGADIDQEENLYHAYYDTYKGQSSMYNGNRPFDIYGTLIVGVQGDANNRPSIITTSICRGAGLLCQSGANVTINNINMHAGYTAITVKANARVTINGGYIESVSSKNNDKLRADGSGSWWSYAIGISGQLNVNDGTIVGVHGGLEYNTGATGEIRGGTFYTHRTEGAAEADNHYALYVSTGSVVNVYGGQYKVETPSAGGNRVILCGNNDAYNYYGVVNMYGGKYQEKAYVTKQKNAESLFPASVPLTSAWYSAFQEKDASNAFAPLPAGYEYYSITEGADYEAGYRYGVRSVPGKEADAIDPAQQAAQEADPTYTIPWQQASTWAADEVPEENTIVTIPVDATVTVSKNEANKDAVADQVFVAQGATLKVEEGTTLTVGDGGMNIGNGGQIVVEAGAAVKIGAAGVITNEEEALVIESNDDVQGVLLYDPAVVENTQPKATVKLTTKAKQIGAESYVFERFAIPTVNGAATTYSIEGGIPTSGLYNDAPSFLQAVWAWDNATDAWVQLNQFKDMQPFHGYQLTNNTAAGGLVYVFEGNLVGNQNMDFNFVENGFHFFGNSYSADINIKSFLQSLGSAVEKTVWVYDPYDKTFKTITERTANGRVKYGNGEAIKDVRSMQAFLMYLADGESGAANVNYASAIWGNPKYGNSASPAPARQAEVAEDWATIRVSAANGLKDEVILNQSEDFTNAFENGADANKFMNKENINLYAVTNAGNLAVVATDDLNNTVLTFAAGNATEYTLHFADIEGYEYTLRDNVTGTTVLMTEGATYTFNQDANTTVPARFEVLGAKVPTAIDNVEAAAKANGIYTITGQFLGHDFTNLPAGVYVVNGVKIVK